MTNIYELTEKDEDLTCVYEIYNKDSRSMKSCGKPAIYKYGKTGGKGLCAEHAELAKSSTGCSVLNEKDELIRKPFERARQ